MLRVVMRGPQGETSTSQQRKTYNPKIVDTTLRVPCAAESAGEGADTTGVFCSIPQQWFCAEGDAPALLVTLTIVSIGGRQNKLKIGVPTRRAGRAATSLSTHTKTSTKTNNKKHTKKRTHTHNQRKLPKPKRNKQQNTGIN